MDHPVACGGGAAKVVEVVEVAAVRLGAGRLDRGGRCLGAGEADDLVARGEEM